MWIHGQSRERALFWEHTLISQCEPSEESFSAAVNPEQLLDEGRMKRGAQQSEMEALEEELAPVLSWPSLCPAHLSVLSFKAPFSVCRLLSNEQCPDPKHSTLCSRISAGRATVGRKKKMPWSLRIPPLSSHQLSAFPFFACDAWS